MPIKPRSGQALIELALGLLVIVLLVSALFYFSRYMTKSLAIQNHLRSSEAVVSAKVEPEGVDTAIFADIFGMKTLHITEPRGSSDRNIKPKFGSRNLWANR